MQSIGQKIQMVDLKTQYSNIKSEIDEAIQAVVESGWFINGPVVKKFAQDLSTYLECAHVIPCGNGTDALQIALMSLGLEPGDEVITTPFTFAATVETIALLGYKPVFVDIDPDTFNIDADLIENSLTDRTKLILPVHLFGQCCEMEKINDLAKKHNLSVIEDNAQAIGATYNFNKPIKTGGIGDLGTLSFFPSKNLGCYGDGGAITTNNEELAQKAQIIAKHGSRVKYYHEMIGINSRLDAIQAAVLGVKLKYLESYTNHRQQAAKNYDKLLANIDEIKTPIIANNSTHVFHQYTLKVERRDELSSFLKSEGISNMIYYPVSLHLQEAYQYLGNKKGQFPICEQRCSDVISLPMHSEITFDQQNFIAEKIQEFYSK